MQEDEIVVFVQAHLRSLWTLELLLLAASDRGRSWTVDEFVSEMRSSQLAVRKALLDLQHAGLIVQGEAGYRFAPANSKAEELYDWIRQAYTQRPSAVVRTIFGAPQDKLRTFADAFRFRKD